MKLKRKDLDEVNDDFSDFSLSSPAFKIRRLDAELPPIMEEEEVAGIPPPCTLGGRGPVVEELGNQERAIVLYKPLNNHIPTPNFTLSVDSDIISGFNNQYPWASSDRVKQAEEEMARDTIHKDSMAVVPWVPSQFSVSQGLDVSQTEPVELMEAEETGEASMEVEEEDNNRNSVITEQGQPFGIGASDGLPQWQQQHCMMPQLPQNNPTPISWLQ